MEIQINVTAVFTTPFNVGTGALADSLAHKPLIKDGQNRPFVPGSALKGRLRHTCEKLIRALQMDNDACCVSPRAETMCSLHPAWLGDYCPVCRLFGAPKRPSPLIFSDLSWNMEEEIQPDIRMGVSIGRKRRAAERNRLFSQETFGPLPQTIYQGTIQGHLVEPDSQALTALLLAGLRDLHTLGASSTGGLGHCNFQTRASADKKIINNDWLKEGLQQWRS